jgi:Dihydrofolate reductase
MIGIIAAVTVNGIIGVENKLPFDYPEDLKHFKATTINSTVIMGRKTFEGIGRPLPKRNNVIISSRPLHVEGISVCPHLDQAILAASMAPLNNQNIWLIGGARIYEEGMLYADEILLTNTPDFESRPNAIRFPWINPMIFNWVGAKPLDESGKLMVSRYKRRITGPGYEQIISQAKLSRP